MLTEDRNEPKLHQTKENGQNEAYLVLSPEERAKGFVRPLRHSYIHVGRKRLEIGEIVSLESKLEDASEFAKNHYTKKNGYAAFLKYSDDKLPVTGRFIKEDELEAMNLNKPYVGGCNGETTMGNALAETYARDPKFYSGTFCVHCSKHFPVDEFVWSNTNELVGS